MLDPNIYNIKQLRTLKKKLVVEFLDKRGLDGEKVYSWLHENDKKKQAADD